MPRLVISAYNVIKLWRKFSSNGIIIVMQFSPLGWEKEFSISIHVHFGSGVDQSQESLYGYYNRAYTKYTSIQAIVFLKIHPALGVKKSQMPAAKLTKSSEMDG